MMKSEVHLYVFGIFPGGEVLKIGRLLSQNLRSPNNYEGFFSYDAAYLQDSRAYPLDPINLPLGGGVFPAANHEIGIPLVFDDSLPDAWGRHILARKGGVEEAGYAPAHLLEVLGSDGLGRLLFSERDIILEVHDNSINFEDIINVISEAGDLEDSVDLDNADVTHLLACGGSAGGARPKGLTFFADILWIAKFASRRDPHPQLFVALEEAGLTLAAMAGLDVPEIRRKTVVDRDLLLIRRFDITPENGRNALISFRTLIGVEDHYSVSYADLARIIRKLSFCPKNDLERLYRQMTVNIVLVNGDDHLQNFAMLHTKEGWVLSPAYDIVPNIYQTEQILQVNGKHYGLTRDDIVGEGLRFGLSRQQANKLLDDVLVKLADWQAVFDDCRVPYSHTVKLRENITQRLKLLSNV